MNKSQTLDELKNIVASKFYGIFPTFFVLRNKYSSLGWHIEKYGGYLHMKRLLGGGVERKPPNYWLQRNNLENEIKNLIKNNKFPTVMQIKNRLGNGAYKAIAKLGGIAEVAKLMGYETKTYMITTDGHHVQSSYEYLFDEYLYANKIPHNVGGLIHCTKRYRYDFKVGDWFIEIWGYNDIGRGKNYCERRSKKELVYKNYNLKLISIELSLFNKSPEEIESHFKSVVSEIGKVVITDFNVANFIHHTRFWNLDNTLKEVQKLIVEIGRFPNTNDMKEKSGMLYGVGKHGGIENFRKLLGFSPSKPIWTNKNIVSKLSDIIKQIKHFPTCHELKEMKMSGLLSAIQSQGGINSFREQMKYPILKKHKRKST